MPAPIAYFVHRRPDHVRRTIDALRQNPEAKQTELFVFSDAARGQKDLQGVTAVRELLRTIEGFAAVHIVERSENFGLSRSITTGVSEVLSRHEAVIVVEDDVFASPHFLRYMNDGLDYYRAETSVSSIVGYCYPVNGALPETFFIKGSDCWGWATWRDRWEHYNPDGSDLLNQLRRRKLERSFDFDGTVGYTQMLMDQIAGKNDSWAVRWYASCFLRDMMALYPGTSVVHNIGLDGTGTHTKSHIDLYDVQLGTAKVKVGGIPLEEHYRAREAFKQFFRDSQPKASKFWIARRAVGAILRRLGLKRG